ncbi:MAG: M48 family metallopeptidase, partial [Pseudomonadota bacterium]
RGKATSGRSWRKVAIWTALAVGSIYAIVFHLVPNLADQMATLIPPEAEVTMGEKMVDQFTGFFVEEDQEPFCSTPQGDAALAAMTARFEAAAGAHVPLTVRVLDHGMVNAFALPGGQIVFFRGLLKEASTPEEAAGVLAHEIAHVYARDPTRLTLRSAGTAGLIGLLLGDFTGATVTVALSEALLRSGYQREAETAADDFANRLLTEQGLPTTPFANFFDKLAAEVGETPELLSHLSTHPELAGRAAAARAADRIGDAPFTPVLSDQEWVALQNICDD